jgi:hypothetical protein
MPTGKSDGCEMLFRNNRKAFKQVVYLLLVIIAIVGTLKMLFIKHGFNEEIIIDIDTNRLKQQIDSAVNSYEAKDSTQIH